jgi:hypothetical protein
MEGKPKKHFTKSELSAMRASNLLELLAKDSDGQFRSKLRKLINEGYKKNSCHALDLVGKLPFSLLMSRIGVRKEDLWVDSALSGGLYSTADGFMPRLKAFIEIKSARLKAGTKNQFQMKKIRILNTSWNYLVFVCRTKPPSDWLETSEYSGCGFWVGVIDRATYVARLKAKGWENKDVVNVTVTPGTGMATGNAKSKSFIGDYIKWTRFEDVKDLHWWNTTFSP